MKVILFSFLVIGSVFFNHAQNINEKKMTELEGYWSDLPHEVTVSLQAETLDKGFVFSKNAERKVPSASLIKIPILFEFFRAVEGRGLNQNALHILQDEEKVGGAGNLQLKEPGSRIKFIDLAKEMIVASDNTATNILIDELGMKTINQFIGTLAMDSTILARKMMDFEAIKQGKQNYTSATDLNRCLRAMMKGKMISNKSRRLALKILKECHDNKAMPKYLKKPLKIAHKTGTLSYVRGDAGIIFTKKSPLVLSILVQGFETVGQADEIIARLTKLIVEQIES